MYCLAHQKNKSDHILTHHNMLRKYSPNFLSEGGCQAAGNGELKCDDTTLSIFQPPSWDLFGKAVQPLLGMG